VSVDDDGITDRWLVADKVGYTTGGVDLDDELGPDGVTEIVITPLPEVGEDNVDYAFQPAGHSASPDTSECGHCHRTIADDWVSSRHSRSANNPYVWDVYVGGTDADEAACAALGGWMAEGQQPGVPDGLLERCYLGAGVLPFLHDACGSAGEQACDHPEAAAALTAFGSCGDCHVPATEGAAPGHIDFARSTGIAHDEGVTCDLCHKVRSVQPGSSPGREAMTLQRPSEPTSIIGQEFDPITFGPYPDVAVGVMKGSYTEQFREDTWCSSCHQYSRPALHPDQLVDPVRWPDGLPILETYEEYLAGNYAGTPDSCQSCHMAQLDEESSTYDITALGLVPSIANGWLRAPGEVRHHHFATTEYEGVTLLVTAEAEDDEVVATVTVRNSYGGHGLPTGAPMRQYIVHVEAVDDDGQGVAASGGQAIPEDGGWRHRGEMDVDAFLDGTSLTLAGQELAEVQTARFVRPTGEWDDHAGPGTGHFDDLAAEDKGLPLYEVLAERTVLSVADDTVEIDAAVPDLLPGDVVYLVGPDDAAGAPGWLYGKTFLDADGVRGVPHYRAVDIVVDNRIAASSSGTSTHRFPAPASGDLTITATLVYRHHRASIASVYGWDVLDEELAVESAVHTAE